MQSLFHSNNSSGTVEIQCLECHSSVFYHLGIRREVAEMSKKLVYYKAGLAVDVVNFNSLNLWVIMRNTDKKQGGVRGWEKETASCPCS